MFNWCGIVFVRACCTPWLVVALLLARAHWHDKLEHSRILTYMISRGEKEIKRARDMTFWQKGWKCFKWFKWEVMHDEIRFITLEDSIHRRPSPHHLRCSECFKDFKFDAIFGRCFKVCPTEQTVLRHSWSLRVSIGLQWIPHDYSLLLTFLEGLSQTWGSSSREVEGCYRLFTRKYRVCRGNAAFLLRRRIVMQCAWVPCWSIHIDTSCI